MGLTRHRSRSSASPSATRSSSPAPTTTAATRSRPSSIELRDDRHPGLVGIGEGYPDRYLRRDAGDDRRGAAVPRRGGRRAGADGRRAWPAPATRWTGAIAHNGGAKCALDIALHDLAGKVAGVPVHRAARACRPTCPPTDFTIGIDEPAVVAERAARAARFPALKIKVGGAVRPRDAAGRPRASTTARSGSTRTRRWELDEADRRCCRSWSSSASS